MKLTPRMLKKIIEEEAAKFGKMTDTEDAADETKETDADELADSVEKHIDFVKALKIEEMRLSKRLKKVQEVRSHHEKKILEKI